VIAGLGPLWPDPVFWLSLIFGAAKRHQAAPRMH
jgi:hypothetical protein